MSAPLLTPTFKARPAVYIPNPAPRPARLVAAPRTAFALPLLLKALSFLGTFTLYEVASRIVAYVLGE